MKIDELIENFKLKFYHFKGKLENWNWVIILLGVMSIQISILIFFYLQTSANNIEPNKSLELILTVNGLFSAILISFFFNRISSLVNSKKEYYDEAVYFSQKITEFRRILNVLTRYYNVWKDDEYTKSLLQHGEYKNIDYYDYKLMSYSDHESNDKKIIDKLNKDDRFKEGQSELFLGMISLVTNRKSNQIYQDDELYKSFEKKGIYNLGYIEKCIEIEHTSRLSYWFGKEYGYINYHHLKEKKQKYILEACLRIDSKYKDYSLNDELMKELCDDMNEHYFKELYILLQKLKSGLSSLDLLVYSILILDLVFGVLLPFLIYFIIHDYKTKLLFTNLIIGINFSLLFFFVINFYTFIKRQITWS